MLMKFATMDNARYRGMRKRMVAELERQGISDQRVLEAINAIPRHIFIDSVFAEKAYELRAFAIDEAQTISHPYTVAFQTEQLRLEKGEKVLEVGTGSGFQACVLVQMGVELYTIERIKALHLKAKQIFKQLNFLRIKTKLGDGFAGWEEYAPFDKIIVTAAANKVPENLLSQLKNGGRMIVPVGTTTNNRDESQQKMILITKGKRGKITQTEIGEAAFVPMLEGKALGSRF